MGYDWYWKAQYYHVEDDTHAGNGKCIVPVVESKVDVQNVPSGGHWITTKYLRLSPAEQSASILSIRGHGSSR